MRLFYLYTRVQCIIVLPIPTTTEVKCRMKKRRSNRLWMVFTKPMSERTIWADLRRSCTSRWPEASVSPAEDRTNALTEPYPANGVSATQWYTRPLRPVSVLSSETLLCNFYSSSLLGRLITVTSHRFQILCTIPPNSTIALHQVVKFWLHAVYLGFRGWVLHSSFACGLLRSSCSYQFANLTSSSPKTEYGLWISVEAESYDEWPAGMKTRKPKTTEDKTVIIKAFQCPFESN